MLRYEEKTGFLVFDDSSLDFVKLMYDSAKASEREKKYIDGLIEEEGFINFQGNNPCPEYHEKLSRFLRRMVRTGELEDLLVEEDTQGETQIIRGNNLIIKTYPDPSDEKILYHEAFIGLKVGNAMRQRGIFNFMWTYGLYRSPGRKQVLILEEIKGKDFRKIIEENDSVKVISCLYQILFALMMANESFKFTHYDLHASNIIIKEVSKTPFYLKYKIAGEDVFVYSPGIIAVMIDFDSSYCEIDGEKYGRPMTADRFNHFYSYNRFTDRDYLLSDVIKLFHHIYYRVSIDIRKQLCMFFAKNIPNCFRNNVDKLGSADIIFRGSKFKECISCLENTDKVFLGLTGDKEIDEKLIALYNVYIAGDPNQGRYFFIPDTPMFRSLAVVEVFQYFIKILEINVPDYLVETTQQNYLQCENILASNVVKEETNYKPFLYHVFDLIKDETPLQEVRELVLNYLKDLRQKDPLSEGVIYLEYALQMF